MIFNSSVLSCSRALLSMPTMDLQETTTNWRDSVLLLTDPSSSYGRGRVLIPRRYVLCASSIAICVLLTEGEGERKFVLTSSVTNTRNHMFPVLIHVPKVKTAPSEITEGGEAYRSNRNFWLNTDMS